VVSAVTAVEIPVTVNDFGRLLQHVEELLEWVCRHAERLLANCRRWLSLLGALMVELERLCAEFERLVRDVLARFRDLLARPGDPVALWLAGNRWLTEVAAPVSARAGTFTADFMHSDNRWDGSAADAYRQTLAPQHDALLRTKDVADATASSLHDVAVAICVYWAAVAGALVTLVVQLSVAAATTVTPPAAPAGAAGGIAALAEFVAVSGVLLTALGNQFGAAVRAEHDLTLQLTGGAAFPAGHWPVSAGAELSDASMTDGDTSDWRLRYR
jgi:hypothetical protein